MKESDTDLNLNLNSEGKLDALNDAIVHLEVKGMTCSSCVQSIENYIGNLDGVNSIAVALLSEKATINYDETLISKETLINEINEMGFEANLLSNNLNSLIEVNIYGMTCSSCTSTVESTVSNLLGVKSIDINLGLEYAKIQFDQNKIGVRDIIQSIQDLGFDCLIRDNRNSSQLNSLSRINEINQWKSALKYSLIFSIPVFIISMVLPMMDVFKPIVNYIIWRGITISDVICLILTIPVQFGTGKLFYKPAFKSLKHHSATMDVLVVFGTSAAFFYSFGAMVCTLFFWTKNSIPPQTFFDTSTMLLTFVTLGRYLENLAKGKTSTALSDLLQLSPTSTKIYKNYDKSNVNNETQIIPTELLQVGDIVKIVPGERLPADGYVINGQTLIDESMITGEPIPLIKNQNDTVIGGTMNGNGSIDFRVTKSGNDTALSQIVQLVEDAQTSKAPIQAFADKIAGFFVPTVISLALITLITWVILSYLVLPSHSLPHIFNQPGMSKFAVSLKLAISTIVVACPCALGLSTPTAVMVGTGVGAKNGILIKGGNALEQASKIKNIVWDKTGTITKGNLNVTSINWNDDYLNELHSLGLNEYEIYKIIHLIESKSEHPLGQAIAKHFNEYSSNLDDLKILNWLSHTGSGIESQLEINGTLIEIKIGNSNLLNNEIKLPTSFQSFENSNTTRGNSIVYVYINNIPIMIISLGDEIKDNIQNVIHSFRFNLNIQSYLMTGDKMVTALSIAQKATIPKDKVFAGVSPKGKRERILNLLEDDNNNGGVAMVGDGINDSPALAASSVGIALASGSSIAIEAADIVIMRQGEIEDVYASIKLSKAIMNKIKLNFIWACAYNIFFIPLAMGLFLPWNLHLHPMMAGFAMACSSISVVVNSLTLKLWKRPSLYQHSPSNFLIFSYLSSLWNMISGRSFNAYKNGYENVPVEMTAA